MDIWINLMARFFESSSKDGIAVAKQKRLDAQQKETGALASDGWCLIARGYFFVRWLAMAKAFNMTCSLSRELSQS